MNILAYHSAAIVAKSGNTYKAYADWKPRTFQTQEQVLTIVERFRAGEKNKAALAREYNVASRVIDGILTDTRNKELRKEGTIMGFGRSFMRGFSWGVGRGVAFNLTRAPRQGYRRMTDKQRYERAHIKGWIAEAIGAYRAQGVQDPSFAQIRRYVKDHFHYTLTK